MRKRKIIITCEHGGNYVPREFRYLFTNHEKELSSHLGWDLGALEVAKYMARHLQAPISYQRVSRLLVESNRSLHSEELFSKYSRELEKPIRKYVLSKYYHPYRNAIEKSISRSIEEGHEVLHLAIHSFTQVLNGLEGQVDIGLLWDESKWIEIEFCQMWKSQIEQLLPQKLVMINIPYNGADDGLTTYLRGKYPSEKYLGIEIEINQKYAGTEEMSVIRSALSNSLIISEDLVEE